MVDNYGIVSENIYVIFTIMHSILPSFILKNQENKIKKMHYHNENYNNNKIIQSTIKIIIIYNREFRK